MATTAELSHRDYQYTIRVIKEWRGSSRYSLGSKFLTIRLPKFMPTHMVDFHTEEAKKWAKQQIDKRISSGKESKPIIRKYEDSAMFEICEQQFQIHLLEKKVKNFSGKIVADRLILTVPEGNADDHISIGKLVSRVMAHYFHPYMLDRVEFYNNIYFKEEINRVRLKNNKSNWGSCSSNANLNFSTRLLFAPKEVIDYVVVHELAHLKEMNHSPAFWKIVRQVMPDYKAKEKWLKMNQHLCHF